MVGSGEKSNRNLVSTASQLEVQNRATLNLGHPASCSGFFWFIYADDSASCLRTRDRPEMREEKEDHVVTGVRDKHMHTGTGKDMGGLGDKRGTVAAETTAPAGTKAYKEQNSVTKDLKMNMDMDKRTDRQRF